MLCTRCHSKITQTIVVIKSNNKFLFATECKNCGLIKYFTKFRYNKLLERGKKMFRGPVGYWARKKFDYVFESRLKNANRLGAIGALKLFINGQEEQENKQAMKLLDEHDLRYVVHNFKDVELREAKDGFPYLYGGGVNAIGIEEIREALETY